MPGHGLRQRLHRAGRDEPGLVLGASHLLPPIAGEPHEAAPVGLTRGASRARTCGAGALAPAAHVAGGPRRCGWLGTVHELATGAELAHAAEHQSALATTPNLRRPSASSSQWSARSVKNAAKYGVMAILAFSRKTAARSRY